MPSELHTLYIDNNVWDFLYARGLDPCIELPWPDFLLLITREAEFELAAIPSSKQLLKDFIEVARRSCVKTHSYFGFAGEHPLDEERMGGFGVGHWCSSVESVFITSERTSMSTGKKPSTRLYRQEADISLGARSFVAVVLSFDSEGALKRAQRQGGRVVNLGGFDTSGMSLRAFIQAELRKSAAERGIT